MKLLLTGASGLVGRFILEGARAMGHEVTCLTRRPGPGDLAWELGGPVPALAGHDALIHCAFAHVPGRYRGGEGDDPAGFIAANRDGSLRLFEAARAAGLAHAVFLSSRAVYGDYPPGTPLREDMAPRPDTLYGRMKAEVEAGLAALETEGFATASLRATGVYGAGPDHKWIPLFRDFLAGKPVAPRIATEVHGEDLADAALMMLHYRARGLYNVSDLVLDHHDLLAEVARLAGSPHRPPARAEEGQLSAMDCSRLAALGWEPGGWPLLHAEMPDLLAAAS